MTNFDILEKAIKQTKLNGYKGRPYYHIDNETLEDLLFDCSYTDIIFSHDFAKAFWGEEVLSEVREYPIVEKDGKEIIGDKPILAMTVEFPAWQFHLQQMVLEVEPVKYLEKFLSKEV
jgi:hypothetical protein